MGRQDATPGQGQPEELGPRGLWLGEEEEAGRGGSSSASHGLASSQACGWNWAPAHGGTKHQGCPLLPCPGQPRLVQGFPPRIYLLLSLFSFFLPHSHPASPPPPPPFPRFVPAGVSRGQPGSCPLPNARSARFSAFLKQKGAQRCPDSEQATETFQKPSKTISFSVPRAPAAARAERRGPRSARSG